MGVGELERVGRDARLPYHVADEGRRPRRIDDGRAQGRLAQDFARRRIGHGLGRAQELRRRRSATAPRLASPSSRSRRRDSRAPRACPRCRCRTAPASISSPATSRDGRGAPAGRRRRSSSCSASVRPKWNSRPLESISMAAEAGELVDRGLRDAPAELARRLRGGGVAAWLARFSRTPPRCGRPARTPDARPSRSPQQWRRQRHAWSLLWQVNGGYSIARRTGEGPIIATEDVVTKGACDALMPPGAAGRY